MTGSTKTLSAGGRTTEGQRTAPRILLAAFLSVAGAASSATAAQAGEKAAPPEVPANLEVPDGNRAFLTTHAYGTQNYICLAAGMPWTFIGPQATLFDDEKQLLTHFLSPNPFENGAARATWQHSRNTSSVWARAIASSTDPEFVEPGAIAWLLLQVVGSQAGPTAGEKISVATYIHRVFTVGGTAPAGACPAAGARVFAPYETDYVFYKAHKGR